MGIIFVSFNASGTIPVCIDMFDKMLIGIQTEALILLSNLVFILSCPKLVFGFIFLSISCTSMGFVGVI